MKEIPPDSDLYKTIMEDKDGNGIPDILEQEGGVVTQSYEVNGVKYNSLEEMPPEHRALFESLEPHMGFDFDNSEHTIVKQGKTTTTKVHRAWSNEHIDRSGELSFFGMIKEPKKKAPTKQEWKTDPKTLERPYSSQSVQRSSSKSGLIILILAVTCAGLAVAYFFK